MHLLRRLRVQELLPGRVLLRVPGLQPVPVRALLAPLAALGALAVLAHWLGPIDGLAVPAGAMGQKQVLALVLCVFSACFVIASGWFAGPGLRQALRS